MVTHLPSPTAPRSFTRILELAWRFVSVIYTLAMAVVAYLYSSGNVFRFTGIAAWLGAVAGWLYVCWPNSPPPIQPGARPRSLSRKWLLLGLTGILIIGVFFRYYRLSETPADPTSDHAEKLLDVQDVLNGEHRIFFPRNTGREPAQFYVIATMVRDLHLPLNFDTMKLGTSAVDVLAIPAMYLVAHEIGGPIVGLATAATYAYSSWPAGIARAGLRFPYAPLPTALVLWLLFRYLRRGDRRDALGLGLALGVGLYGYSPFRVVALVLPIAFGVTLLFDRRWSGLRSRLLQDGAIVIVTTVLVFIPLGHFMLERPGTFWYRAVSRTVDLDAPPEARSQIMGEDLQVFLLNNLNAALSFNVRGDSTMVNAPRFEPFFDPVTGVFFLVGVGLAIFWLVRRRDLRMLILLASLPVLFLSSTLALGFPVENPSVNRSGPALPVAFTLVGLGAGAVLQWGFATRDWRRRVVTSTLVACAFCLGAALNYERYFVRFDHQTRLFVANTTEIALAVQQELDQNLTLNQVYILSWPYWNDARNIGIKLGDISWGDRHDIPETGTLPAAGRGDMLFIFNREDRDHLVRIQTRWPDAVIRLIPAEIPGKEFYLARVPSEVTAATSR